MTPRDDIATLRGTLGQTVGIDARPPHAALAALSRLETELARLEEDLAEVTGFWQTTQFPEFIEYWFTIGRSCSAGDAIRQLLGEKHAAEAEVARLREGLRYYFDAHQRQARDVGGGPCICEMCQEARSLLADNQETA